MLTILFSLAGSINLLLATRSRYLLLNDCLKELYYHLQLLRYISCCTTMLSSVVVGVFKLMSRFGYLIADVITMIELKGVASVDQITPTFHPQLKAIHSYRYEIKHAITTVTISKVKFLFISFSKHCSQLTSSSLFTIEPFILMTIQILIQMPVSALSQSVFKESVILLSTKRQPLTTGCYYRQVMQMRLAFADCSTFEFKEPFLVEPRR